MSDALPEGLDGLEPEQVLAFLRSAGEDEIREAVRGVGTARVLELAVGGMAERFAPDPGRSAGTLAFALTDGKEQHPQRLHLDAEGARYEPGEGPARATVGLDMVRFLKIGAGAADPKRLLVTGRMRVRGDLIWLALVLRGLQQ